MAERRFSARRRGRGDLLEVKGLEAWYGKSHILHGVDLDVREGEVVTLLGRNGAGKTTTLKAIMGIVGKRTGSVRFDGRELIGLPIERIARLGVALCPEERAHLRQPHRQGEPAAAAARSREPAALSVERIFALFPNLRERLAQRRRQALGRRAADAGDRPDPAHRRALPDARRADRGPGSGHHPADRPHHRAS